MSVPKTDLTRSSGRLSHRLDDPYLQEKVFPESSVHFTIVQEQNSALVVMNKTRLNSFGRFTTSGFAGYFVISTVSTRITVHFGSWTEVPCYCWACL